MTALVAAVAGVGTFLLVTKARPEHLALKLAEYLAPASLPLEARPNEEEPVHRLGPALIGLGWSLQELRLRRLGAIVAGALVGALLAQGDLFVAGPSRSVPALAVLGGAGGLVVFSMWVTNQGERRARRLLFELPVVADSLALHVLSGESVPMAVQHLIDLARGVAADELRSAIGAYREGESLPVVLRTAAAKSAHREAGRLYTLLSNAHVSGGRLAASLSELAVDYRAMLARDLTSEGGRRALTSYGPILLLMVPVALLFLMYPTLAGLGDLAIGN